jgi:hypothetical protein
MMGLGDRLESWARRLRRAPVQPVRDERRAGAPRAVRDATRPAEDDRPEPRTGRFTRGVLEKR